MGGVCAAGGSVCLLIANDLSLNGRLGEFLVSYVVATYGSLDVSTAGGRRVEEL